MGVDGGAWTIEHQGDLVDVRKADASSQLRQRISVSPAAITIEDARIDLLTDSDVTGLSVDAARSLARALTIAAAELEASEVKARSEPA